MVKTVCNSVTVKISPFTRVRSREREREKNRKCGGLEDRLSGVVGENDETKRRGEQRGMKCREKEKRERRKGEGEKIALTFDGMVDIMVTLCPRAAKAFINA